MEKKTILYIDDSAVERKIVRQLLVTEGFEVLTTGDPEEGVRLASEMHPDLILLDLHLAETDGCAVARRLREVAGIEEVPIVALSASINDEERPEVLRMFDGYVQKPVDVGMFPRVVREFIQQGRDGSSVQETVGAAEEPAAAEWSRETLEVLETLEKVRATLSHDLRTPLTVMISYASTVGREKVGELTDRQKEMLKMVVDQGFKMDAMITDLVRTAKETLRRYDYPRK